MKLVIFLFLISTCLVSGTIIPLHRRQRAGNSTGPLIVTESGVSFEIEVQVNNQTFYLLPDTGSSDLWVPVSGFQCIDSESGSDVPQEACQFGATYQVPSSTEYVANQTFGVQYGDGIALGKLAYANVTLNGVVIHHQKIGLVDRTNDFGDGIGSGILGLGFPALTSAHPGTILGNSTLLANRAVYDPVFVSMYKEGLVEPWYSFAIEAPPINATSGPGGWLGLGQLPPVMHSDDWATMPIQPTEGLPEDLTGGRNEISLMTLTVDGLIWKTPLTGDSTINTTSFQAVVDTGNPMNLVPAAVAEAVNSAFNPPAVFNDDSRVFVVDCNATTPEFGVILDGHTFWQRSPDDLIYHHVDGSCYSSIGPTGQGSGLSLNFLGSAFLRNVVFVVDFGKEEMRFAARVATNSSGSPPQINTATRFDSLSWWRVGAVSAAVLWWY